MKNQYVFFRLLTLSLIWFVFVVSMKAQQKVQADDRIISVYNFQQIEPFFHPSLENDTTYIFNFWATYCAPCIKELPYFDQIGEEFRNQKLKILLISLDFKSQIETGVLPFIKKRAVKSPVVVLNDPDANAWIDKVSNSWTGAIPATLIVKGNSREFYEKAFTYDELKLVTIKFLEK